MSDARRPPDPSELVYAPAPSWAPVLVAVGLAGLLVGLFAGLPYAVAGAVLGLLALRYWVRGTSDEIGRLPRQQRLSTAVLPPTPLRRSASGE
ncbi:MAG: hypothetical protein ACRDK1_03705 [Solirubrobacterales bacterium]